MKKLAALILATTLLFSFALSLASCDFLSEFTNNDSNSHSNSSSNTETTSIKLPDVSGLDETTCKTLLVNKGLIPKIDFEYSDTVSEGLVTRTDPAAGSSVKEDDIITVYISKGKSYYKATNAVGYMKNITGVDAFVWGENGEKGTKEFYTPYVSEGYFYMPMCFICRSDYSLSFYSDFATASINEDFVSSVPATIVGPYEYVGFETFKKEIDNTGEVETLFCVKIPMSSLDNKNPNNIYISLDILVDGTRQTFKAGFDIAW